MHTKLTIDRSNMSSPSTLSPRRARISSPRISSSSTLSPRRSRRSTPKHFVPIDRSSPRPSTTSSKSSNDSYKTDSTDESEPSYHSVNFNDKTLILVRQSLPRLDSLDRELMKKSCCQHVSETIPLVFKNCRLKLKDHLLLGGEHTRKISPGYNSPIIASNNDLTPDEKTEVVLQSPSFGMFSLFRYHLYRGYLNKELRKTNKIYCSHIFSLIFALPIIVFVSQWLLYIALMQHEIKNFDGGICTNSDTFENKLMISGISMIYFVRSFFIWDNITNTLSLAKMNRVSSMCSVLDTFQEFSFTLFVYCANIWVVFIDTDIQNMILNSLAMEFLMVLDNEFEELYFKYLPGSGEDIYDNIFVYYEENKKLLEEREKNDNCFRCFSCCMFIPYKFLVLLTFLFPIFCAFMIFAGPLCK